MPMMLRAFKENFELTLPGRPRNTAVVAKLNHHLDEIIKHIDEDESSANNRKTLYRFRALHDAIATADEILTGNTKPASVSTSTATTATETSVPQPNGGAPQPSASTEPSRPPPRNATTSGRIPGLDEADHQRRRRIAVQDVLRAHIQEVLRILNERDARASDQRFLTVTDAFGGGRPQSRGRGRSPSQSSHQDVGPSLEDMDEATPDERQHRLMELYFLRVRRVAVPRARESAHRRQSIIRPAAASRRGSVGSNMSTVTEAAAPPLSPGHPLREVANAGDDGAGNTDRERAQLRAAAAALSTADTENAIDSPAASPRDGQPPAVTFALFDHSVAEQIVTYDDIWCTLVFRMICWLMLHDFSKSDQQIPRSELLGSRMPVYIE